MESRRSSPIGPSTEPRSQIDASVTPTATVSASGPSSFTPQPSSGIATPTIRDVVTPTMNSWMSTGSRRTVNLASGDRPLSATLESV
jgi:hypothetical protein